MGWIFASFLVGLFYACAGFNKLFDERRSNQMLFNLMRIFNLGPSEGMLLAGFVSSCQLGFGLLAMAGAVTLTPWICLWANVILGTISATAYVADGHRQMRRTWNPSSWSDLVACMLYTPEALLLALSLVAITGVMQ